MSDRTVLQALSPDMRDFLALLVRHEVRFAVCGGFAVSFHGFIRATMDLDVLVYPSAGNARRLMHALDAFGFGRAGIEERAFLAPGTAVTLGAQPNQIDILTSMSSADADSIFADIIEADLWGLHIPVVSRRALLNAKRESARPKDRIDYEELLRIGEIDKR
mgnify:CR=1 FL=1